MMGIDDILFDNITDPFDSSNHSKPSSPAADRAKFDDGQSPSHNEILSQSTETDLTGGSE